MTALYVHIPFCARKCAYCDFASYAGREADFGRYLAALKEELRGARDAWGPLEISSVFFGGGTPTLLPADALCDILETARSLFVLASDAEITTEGNPGTVDGEKLRMLRSAGVNRVSFGAQSFSDRLLAMLGRIHRADTIGAAVDAARAAGIANINLDLMYGLPEQSADDWADTLRAALALNVPHLSCYSLINEEGTALTARIESGELAEPDEETVLAMQHTAARMLAECGLARYEISNYARPGFECLHNLCYWRRGDYLGVGAAAHSLMRGERFSNPASLDEYLAGVRHKDSERLSKRDEIEEAILLETRTARGIDLAEFHARYEVLLPVPRELIADGYMREEGGRLFCTEKGFDVQDAVVLALIDALPDG